jgi:pilus assembly protein CpaB
MGERRFGFVLVIALAVAALAGYGVYYFLQQAQASARVPTGRVVVAAVDLLEGKAVTAVEAKVIELPLAGIPPGAFTNIDSVVGRVTRIPVFANEVLVPGRLAPVGSGAGLEVKIAPGKRAMAVRIDDVVGLSGLIQPNSRVDVLVMLRDDGTGQQQRAKVFMENMRVLSVGSQIERGPDGRPMNETTAALEVTPAEAEQLAVATGQGKIQLVLRGYGDPDSVRTRGASINDIPLGRAVVVARPAPEPERRRPSPQRTVTAPPPPVITLAPPPAARVRTGPDSGMVQIYRGPTVSQQRVEKRDSTKP